MLNPDKEKPSAPGLSSVATAARMLKTFTAEVPELGVTALARQLGIAKSSAHRVANTLVAEGLLERNPDNGQYRLGLLLFSMGTLVRRRMDFAAEAAPYLHQLCDQTGETVQLAVLNGHEILYLRNIESKHAIRPRSYLGVRKPALSTGEGRVLLAFGSPVALAQALQATVVARTPQTVTDRQALGTILEQVRHKGYAVDDEESEVGMRGIAAPIFDATGAAIAAVGLAAPVQRLTKVQMRKLIAAVTANAAAISQRLGHVHAG